MGRTRKDYKELEGVADMVWVVMIVMWGLFLVCIFRGRKEQGDILQRASMYLYKKISRLILGRKSRKAQDGQVRQQLIALHPGKEPVTLLTEYYIGKIRIVILILLIGSSIACCSQFVTEEEGISLVDGILERPKEAQTVTLEAVVEGEEIIREKVVLEVLEKTLSEAEAESLCEQLREVLEEMILGKNPSLKEVREDLYLPYEVEGYPFLIDWKSSDIRLLDRDGRVYIQDLEQSQEVILEAEITYGEYEWHHSYQIVLWPPYRTQREQMMYDLAKMSQEAQMQDPYEESFSLPGSIDGRAVTWSVKKESTGLGILFMTFLAAVVVYFMKDRDLQEELIERRMKMKAEYPVIVSKFALLLEAGLTVRGAFIKICRDYYEKEPMDIQPVYEEMYYSCNELKAGGSESKVYESFGRRTGTQEYTRLCTLLSQNLKKGSTALSARLKEESDMAAKEGLQHRKRLGEEAGTKLLAPMGMLLIMILVMLILPAFSGLEI